ncbi:MAG: DUF1275 domain-containing protein, partial [Chlamydiae bacterium]|nr:DUF1275 domain-containing protein [Chlamydiota bacterium]
MIFHCFLNCLMCLTYVNFSNFEKSKNCRFIQVKRRSAEISFRLSPLAKRSTRSIISNPFLFISALDSSCYMKQNVLSRLRFPPLPCTQQLFTGFMMACIAGFVDVFCFVEVNQLFTAHITGNIIIAIAEIIAHVPGVLAKLVALPIFLIIVMIVTSIIEKIGQTKRLLISLLLTEAVLLAVFAIIGHLIMPLGHVRSWPYISTGMIAVSAMAIHNTLLRTFM